MGREEQSRRNSDGSAPPATASGARFRPEKEWGNPRALMRECDFAGKHALWRLFKTVHNPHAVHDLQVERTFISMRLDTS